MPKIKKVAVIGLGYVGLPTFIAITKTKKYQVVGYARTEEKIKKISKGIVIYAYPRNPKNFSTSSARLLLPEPEAPSIPISVVAFWPIFSATPLSL